MYRGKKIAVNMGAKKGVQALVKQTVPHVLAIHCINHNLELSIFDVKKQETYMKKFDTVLKEVFKLYFYSPKRRRELADVAEMLDEKLKHFGGLKEIRWLSSQYRAVKALGDNFYIAVTHLEDMSNGKGTDCSTCERNTEGP